MARLEENTNSLAILRNFRKFSKNFYRKFRKVNYFSIFSKSLANNALIFFAFGRKLQIVGKFWEKFGNFEKNLEIFDENSIEELDFYLFLGKVVAKNRAFGNNIIFLEQNFQFLGGKFRVFPLETHIHNILWISNEFVC